VKKLWQILVPQEDISGEFIPVEIHNKWDRLVREVTGGLTIHRSAKGNWISSNGKLVVERMIPVTIHCSKEQMRDIAYMTKRFYNQEAIMYWKISDDVFIV
jgi:hypothetical protein